MSHEGKNRETDRRPDPKPRKHPRLWQTYLWWSEIMELRKRHTLRISSIEHGKSNLDAGMERNYMEMFSLDALVDPHTKAERAFSIETEMLKAGEELGEIWAWATAIRGLGAGGLAAQLFAMIDDVAQFETVSKLWRFCGYGCPDGKIDIREKGERAHYNARLKSIIYLIVDQFIKQQTDPYAAIYYEEKGRQRGLHPNPVCRECGSTNCKQKKNKDGHMGYRCSDCGGMVNFNPAHIHARAIRKTAEIFLQHLWVKWRECEGLPTGEPYVQAVMGHEHIIGPDE